MRCSVIVPTYNRADLLAWTLHSLVEQDLAKDDFEVLVVDDGSSDNTRERVAEFASRLRLRYFYQPDEGYRVAKARNVGIAAARGVVCVLVDSGVLLASGALRAHCEAHEKATKPLAVCGYVYAFNENNEDAVAIRASIDPFKVDETISRFNDARLYSDLREEFYAKYGDDFNHLPAPWLVYWTCNVSAKRSVLEAIGLFDENFKTWGGEDVELGYRLHRSGCSFALVRAAASIHYPHEKSYERNMSDARTSYRYFAAKYGTPITALVVSTHFFVLNDIIINERIPGCEEFLRTRGQGSPIEGTPRMETMADRAAAFVVPFWTEGEE
jgi:glycosyltransferase involved in cell wall biosynthesis